LTLSNFEVAHTMDTLSSHEATWDESRLHSYYTILFSSREV